MHCNFISWSFVHTNLLVWLVILAHYQPFCWSLSSARKQLMQWKIMEGYNFFNNKHVHTVFSSSTLVVVTPFFWTSSSCIFQLPSYQPCSLNQLGHLMFQWVRSLVCYQPPYLLSLTQRLSEAELMAECERVFKEVKVTEEEAEYLTKATQLQSESLLWLQHLHGHLAASKFLSLSRTKVESLSQSLIDNVLQNKPPTKTVH